MADKYVKKLTTVRMIELMINTQPISNKGCGILAIDNNDVFSQEIQLESISVHPNYPAG
ncbi:MAG: hypothetical protein AAGU27_12940 [Dehalobacterium sp.]